MSTQGEILNLSIFEERFRSIFDEAPFSAALLSGGDFVIEMANQASLTLWGRDPSIIGKPLLEAIPEIKGQQVFEILKRVYQSGAVYEGKEETAILSINGELKKIYVNLVYKPIRDKVGTITGVLAVGYDVTQQVVAKQMLIEADTRLRLAIDTAELGTFEIDFATGQLKSSPRFQSFFELDNKSTRWDFVARIHPDDRKISDEAFEHGISSGKIAFESRLMMPDQSVKWARVHGAVFFDEKVNPVKIIGTAIDITEEKTFLRKLQESEERFRLLITETPEVGAGLYLGPELKIQYVNDVMLRFWGKDKSIIGKSFKDALPELEGQRFFTELDDAFATGRNISGTEVIAVLNVDDKPIARFFNYTYKPLKDHEGKVYGIHHMAVDVTDQVKAKMALVESEESVRRLFEQTPVGIAVLRGKELVVEMVNATMLSYWGRTREQLMNKPLWQAFPEVDRQIFDPMVKEVWRKGISYSSPETKVTLNRNGKMETIITRFAFEPQMVRFRVFLLSLSILPTSPLPNTRQNSMSFGSSISLTRCLSLYGLRKKTAESFIIMTA